MKLSTKGRYAVMAMVDLARNTAQNPVALSEIAERQGISLSYLEQLFSRLRREGLVNSVRGPGGGYRLGKDANDISISDIILSVDEPLTAMGCDDGGEDGCTGTGRCVTHKLWRSLTHRIHGWLEKISLEDVKESLFEGADTDSCDSVKKNLQKLSF